MYDNLLIIYEKGCDMIYKVRQMPRGAATQAASKWDKP